MTTKNYETFSSSYEEKSEEKIEEKTKKKLQKLTNKYLIKYCKDNKIKGYSNKNKENLIKFILQFHSKTEEKTEEIPKINENILNIISTISNIQNNKKLEKLYFDFCFLKKSIPPNKNINKFPYGLIGEKIIVDFINDIGIKCNHYDDKYKYDCEIMGDQYSIKILSKKSHMIIINKNSNYKHKIININFIVFIQELNKIYIFQLNESMQHFIKDNSSNISLKSGIFTHLDKNPNNYINIPNHNIDMSKPIKEIDIIQTLFKEYYHNKNEYLNNL